MAMEIAFVSGAGVLGDENMEVLLKTVPGRRGHTAFGGQSRQHQRVHPLSMQLTRQTGMDKGAVALLGNHALARQRQWSDEVRAVAALHAEIRSILTLARPGLADHGALCG